ncbi:hypothetical protein FQN57_003192 [Myotisia sp. PD_48]|nr:hypothetical protein FQN57_003192 [Myotisia sp. PD_48]
MAFWPFGRRRKRGRKHADDETRSCPDSHSQQLTRPETPPAQTTSHNNNNSNNHEDDDGLPARRDSKRRKHMQTRQFGNETSNFPKFPIPASTLSTSSSQAIHPALLRSNDPILRHPVSLDTFTAYHDVSPQSNQRLTSTMSYQVPTLHGKRNTTEPAILRRKSWRRRKHDPEREREIKNMSSFTWNPRQNPKDAVQAKNRHLSDPSSSYSDQFSGDDSCTYKLSAFSALTPRPFLRYAETGRPVFTPTRQNLSRSSTRRLRQTDKSTIAGHHRIESLADDMDAGALTELMQRDRRRKLMKRRPMKENVIPQPQTHRHHQQPVGSTPDVSFPENDKENKIETKSDDVPAESQSSRMSLTKTHSGSWFRDPSRESISQQHSAPSSSKHLPATVSKADETTSAVSATKIPPPNAEVSPAYPSVVENKRDSLTNLYPQSSFSDADASSKNLPQNKPKVSRSWTQLFKRRSLRRKVAVVPKNNPSEFSVTSRGSSSLNPRMASPYPIPIAGTSHRAGTDGQSSRSRFTEHLDDVPHGTRLYTGESAHTPRDDAYSFSYRMSVGTAPNGAERYSMSGVSTTATAEPRDTRRSFDGNSPADTRPNSTFLAQSLASIDSEGSWLSGKPSRRLSQLNQVRGSAGSTRERLDNMVDPNGEDEIPRTSEEFFGTLPVPREEEEEDAHQHDHAHTNQRQIVNRSATPEESENDNTQCEDFETEVVPPTLHSGVGRRPQLINPQSRAKSTEGLFTEFLESADEVSPVDEQTPELGRATSVDFGKGHARHMSAGSAKVVDISKRYSIGSMSSGVLPDYRD